MAYSPHVVRRLERAAGIEPACSVWKTGAYPSRLNPHIGGELRS